MKRQFVDIDGIEGRFENRIPEHRKQSVFPLLAQLKREYVRMSFVIQKLTDAERKLRAVLIVLHRKRAQVEKNASLAINRRNAAL